MILFPLFYSIRSTNVKIFAYTAIVNCGQGKLYWPNLFVIRFFFWSLYWTVIICSLFENLNIIGGIVALILTQLNIFFSVCGIFTDKSE